MMARSGPAAEREDPMIRRVLRRSLAELWLRRDPVGYFRSKGFQIGEGCSLVAAACGMLGTEPTLVTLGNRVVVSLDVLFITHDGGVWVIRDEVGPMDVFGESTSGMAHSSEHAPSCCPGSRSGVVSVVGAGAVVTRSVPDDVVVAGCPARIVSTTEEYRERLRPDFHATGGLPIGTKHEYLRKLDGSGLIQRGWMSLPGDTEQE